MDPATVVDLPNVINLNRWVDAIVGGNWLFIAVILVMFREISRITGNPYVLAAYQVLGAMFKFLRPSTELREQAPAPLKPVNHKKLPDGATAPEKKPPGNKPEGSPG